MNVENNGIDVNLEKDGNKVNEEYVKRNGEMNNINEVDNVKNVVNNNIKDEEMNRINADVKNECILVSSKDLEYIKNIENVNDINNNIYSNIINNDNDNKTSLIDNTISPIDNTISSIDNTISPIDNKISTKNYLKIIKHLKTLNKNKSTTCRILRLEIEYLLDFIFNIEKSQLSTHCFKYVLSKLKIEDLLNEGTINRDIDNCIDIKDCSSYREGIKRVCNRNDICTEEYKDTNINSKDKDSYINNIKIKIII
ncbi:hypothetical protein NAPIS_ORF02457 [Vairimorpha apis BRL 01]|uniref:Uncharacterized protein n=1 Tax=Vairimorpha apis BRL 01 TaxID=1037528 RepID=T0MG32_9MICR|nr:hypothetical protein NAPIS_ORF02457 [Vairimorpha apis BRL 01]